MILSEKLFDNKNAAMKTVCSLYARHGNGLDISICSKGLCLDVLITRFRKGIQMRGSSFSIDPQEGGINTIIDITEERMENALKECGAEFTSVREFLKRAGKGA